MHRCEQRQTTLVEKQRGICTSVLAEKDQVVMRINVLPAECECFTAQVEMFSLENQKI